MIAVRRSTSDSRLWLKDPNGSRSRLLLAEGGRAHGTVACAVFRMLSSSQSDIVSRKAEGPGVRGAARACCGDRRSVDAAEALDLTFADASPELPSALSQQMRHLNLEYLELQEEVEQCQQDLARIMVDLAQLKKQRSCLSTRLKFLKSLVSTAFHKTARSEDNEGSCSSGKKSSDRDALRKPGGQQTGNEVMVTSF